MVTVKPQNAAAFEAAMGDNVAAKVGEVTEAGELVIKAGGSTVASATLGALKEAWQTPLSNI